MTCNGRRGGLLWGAAVLAIGITPPEYGWAQGAACPCEPSPQVRAALERLPDDDQHPPQEASHEQQRDRLRALLTQHPDDVFVHRRRQDAFGGAADQEARRRMIAEYQTRAEREPRNPIAQYLYARALEPHQWETAVAVVERALATAPDCAQLHLLATELYQHREKEKALRHWREFMRLCPQSLEGYAYASLITDPAELQATAERLRARLSGAPPSRERATAYARLWRLEFRARPPAEHAQLRLRIQNDVRMLRTQNRVTDQRRLRTLYEGYGYLGDEAGRRWVEAQLERHFPQSRWRWEILDKRWEAEHPHPEGQATPEQIQVYYRALLRHTEQKISVLPDDFYARLQHFEALTRLPDSKDEQVLRAADELLRALDRPSNVVYAVPPIQIRIARRYAARRLRLDHIPELIQAGLRGLERQVDSQGTPPEMKRIHENNLAVARQEGWAVLFDLSLELRRYDAARNVLAEMKAALTPERDEAASASDGSPPAWRRRLEWLFWEWSGRLAEAEGRRLDAAVFYQRAGRKDKAQPLWLAAGGTDEGWTALQAYGPPPPRTPPPTPATIGWTKRETPLPAFTLSDLRGRAWTLTELRGKAVFINIWATWCGPCKQELPQVQKLYERLKDRTDVVVLSFNVDEDVGLVEPFIRKQGYTFPVIPAKAYVETVTPQLAVPRNWLLAPNGVLRMEQVGFRLPGDQWITQVIEMMENIRREPA